MLKALLKKQFLEMNTFYFKNRKTGKMRSKGGTIGMIILFAFVFISVGFAFWGAAFAINPILQSDSEWLYFALMGMISIAMGTFGSVFNTYAGMYHAKDNELLLSMPIKPSQILIARMSNVYLMSLLYSAIAWIPTIIVYLTYAKINVLALIFQLLLTLIIALFVTVLTCALGWVVALISGKLKNKSFLTVLISLVFLGAYFYVFNRMNTFLQVMMTKADEIGRVVKVWIFPIYQLGLASCGKVLPMIIFTAICIALTAICLLILSKSFTNIVTSKKADKKEVYVEKTAKKSSVKSALIRKELKRFTSSPTYMLNSGLGIVMLPALAIFALVKADTVRGFISSLSVEMPIISTVAPAIAAALICMCLATIDLTSSSVSLEGKNIWILQSMPVKTSDILDAKQTLQYIMTAPFAIIASVILGIVIEADFTQILYMAICTVGFSQFISAFGLFLNLKKPNLTWTNETVVIKQSISVMIALFGGWIVALIIGGAGFLVMSKFSFEYYNLAAGIVMILLTRLLNNWIKTSGAEIFNSL